ncbi:hypothetical protein [Kineococcus rhizosphaerae]|uniref:Uncharacterized protein n=1 Tax=Kineococcus rhizosphaerae TaxID=559628 RepID=A0A2T0R141_9ACTN|nr:hypothetical protein [Kineococcus rhizosphaerae]PRY12961.1 hypothetical protein CLV37_109148 [Kineococcus rhizosphaerae]
MPASSLIFLVIIALVAAHVLPDQIRKHRRTASARQADRDSDAMRVVVRRGAAPVGQALAAAAVNAAVASSSSRPVLGRGAGSVATQAVPVKLPLKPLRRNNSRVVARRRRLLGTIAALTLLGWALVVAGLAPWWSGAVPTLGLLLVVGALGRHGAASPAPVAVPATVVLPAVRQPRAVSVPVQRDERPSPLAGDRGWEPVPVPLPTYLLKDRARTWDPVSPAVAAARLLEADVEQTRVIDLREHAQVVNQ